MTYGKQNRQGKQRGTYLAVQMDARTGSGSDIKKREIAKRNNGQEVVQIPDPEWIGHEEGVKEEEEEEIFRRFFLSFHLNKPAH